MMFCHTCNAEFSREEAKEVLIGEDDCDLKCPVCGSSRKKEKQELMDLCVICNQPVLASELGGVNKDKEGKIRVFHEECIIKEKEGYKINSSEKPLLENWLTEKEITELCKKEGCFCPEDITTKAADTPIAIRLFFMELGRREARKQAAAENEKIDRLKIRERIQSVGKVFYDSFSDNRVLQNFVGELMARNEDYVIARPYTEGARIILTFGFTDNQKSWLIDLRNQLKESEQKTAKETLEEIEKTIRKHSKCYEYHTIDGKETIAADMRKVIGFSCLEVVLFDFEKLKEKYKAV